MRKKWIWPTRQKPLPTSATAAPNVWRMKRFRRALKNVAESSIRNRRAAKANKRNENKKSNLPHRPRKKLCRQLFRKQVAQNDSQSSRIAIRNEERLFFPPISPRHSAKFLATTTRVAQLPLAISPTVCLQFALLFYQYTVSIKFTRRQLVYNSRLVD